MENIECEVVQEKKVHGTIMCISNLIRRNLDHSETKKKMDKLTNMNSFIIGYLYKNKDREIFQKDIEEVFSYRRSTASAVIGLMEEKGYVVRNSVEYDKRLKRIELTPKALQMGIQIEEDIKRLEGRMTEGIGPEELEIFYKVAGKIKRNLM